MRQVCVVLSTYSQALVPTYQTLVPTYLPNFGTYLPLKGPGVLLWSQALLAVVPSSLLVGAFPCLLSSARGFGFIAQARDLQLASIACRYWWLVNAFFVCHNF
jgi:hypothetical protein